MNRFLSLTNIIASLLTIILSIPAIYGYFHGELELIYSFVGIIAMLYLCLLVQSLKNGSVKFLYYFNYLLGPKYGYIMNLRETKYEFMDRTHMRHEKKYEIKSLVNNLSIFTDRYFWSKDSKCVVEPLYKKHYIAYQWMDEGANFFSILFENPNKKGSVIHTGIKIDNLVDENKESELFLSTGIYERTKKLRMLVKFNKELIPKNIKLRIFKDASITYPIFEYELKYDYENCHILYEDSYPIYGYKYNIVWEFEE